MTETPSVRLAISRLHHAAAHAERPGAFGFSTPFFARLLEMSMCPRLAQGPLAIKLALESSQGFLDWFAAFKFYL